MGGAEAGTPLITETASREHSWQTTSTKKKKIGQMSRPSEVYPAKI